MKILEKWLVVENKKAQENKFLSFVVPQAGLEPARPNGHRILSPACLPVPPPGHGEGRKKKIRTKVPIFPVTPKSFFAWCG